MIDRAVRVEYIVSTAIPGFYRGGAIPDQTKEDPTIRWKDELKVEVRFVRWQLRRMQD